MATTKKKPTAAQLAARKLFAQRAKAGTLKKATKRKPAAKRAKNPTPAKRVARRPVALVNSTVCVVESSKNGREWMMEKIYLDSGKAKSHAERYADKHPTHYVRVRTEKPV